jgi:hypothetical protein
LLKPDFCRKPTDEVRRLSGDLRFPGGER